MLVEELYLLVHGGLADVMEQARREAGVAPEIGLRVNELGRGARR